MKTTRAPARARAAGIIAAGLCVGLALGVVPASRAGAATAPGFGHSAALTFQIDPRTAGLGYQVTFGASLADHQNTVARAQAQTANFGLIGTAASAPNCQGDPAVIKPEYLPKPVRVDSRQPGADQGTTETMGPFTQSARASARPFAESSTTIAPLDLGGVVSFMGGASHSTSGLDASDKPVSTAETDIGGISLGGGAVELQGLHWRSASRPGASDPTSSFWIDSVKIAGVAAPKGDGLSAIDTANVVLLPLGFFIGVPKVHTDNGTTFVDPLRIAIVPSQLRDSAARPVLSGAQPIRQAVFQFLLDRSPCQYSPSSAILVADIITLSVTGGGSMGFNVGGTQAQTLNLPPSSVGYDFGSSNTAASLPNFNSGAATTPGAFTNDGTLPTIPPTEVLGNGRSNGTGGNAQALPASSAHESDNAKWVALAVIGLGLALVEGELRLRRRARVDGAAS